MKLTSQIRKGAKEIIENSRDLLEISWEKVKEIPQRLNTQKEVWLKDSSMRDKMSIEAELGLNFFFNTVNFCFKDPKTGKEYEYKSKSRGIIERSTGLFFALAESGVNWSDLAEVKRLTGNEWKNITQLNNTDNRLYLGVERLKHITGFAEHLLAEEYETVEEFLEVNRYDAVPILRFLAESGYFEDEFLKRAQVAIHGIENVLLRRKGEKLKNVETLTCMADYRIPQVFYNLGAVELSDSLRSKLEEQNQIQSESKEELALRATVIVIGEKLSKLMGIPESEVDGLLWRLSQKMMKDGQLQIPHMVVATDKY
jgi:hypothetical protein